MKITSFLRGQPGLQTMIPTASKNVQEVEPTIRFTVATSAPSDADRPNVLSKRSARWARRNNH